MEEHDNQEYLFAEANGSIPSDLSCTLWELLHDTAMEYPEREAVVSLWQDGLSENDCLRWTYADILGKAQRLAACFVLDGVNTYTPPNSRPTLVAVTWNSAEWSLLFWTSLYMGVTFVPLDPRNPNELPQMLEAVQPDILVVEDEELAHLVNTWDMAASQKFICQGSMCNWIGINEILNTQSAREPLPERHSHDPALVVFTSGTTGASKGCPHTNVNLISQTDNFDANIDPEFIDRWMIHTPVSHIFAVNNAIRAWRNGGAAIFPSKTFAVDSTIQALVEEQCTIMAATPTLVKALHASPSFPTPDKLNLSVVTIAATSITTDDIRLCREGLGAKDAIQAYGMSEGAPIISWCRQDPTLVNGYHSGVGRVLPGCRIRICHPDTRHILQTDEVGELHIGGTSVISGYLNNEDADSFYTDASGHWLITRDQAYMDKYDIVYILGRYKDLIIRGGENIQPTTIEAAIATIPGIQVQVVGVPHRLAGQVPVAVVSLPDGISKADVCAKARDLGLKYALDTVYTLEELGFSQTPVTSLNKSKKGVLQESIARLQDNNGVDMAEAQRLKVQEALLKAWEQVIGTRPQVHDKLRYFADSITQMEYCYVVEKYNIHLHLSDFNEEATVAKHAEAVTARASSTSSTITSSTPPHWSPTPTRSSSVSETKSEEEEKGSIPIRRSLRRMIAGPRPQSFNVRLVLRISNPKHLTRALEKLCSSRPLFQSEVTKSFRHVITSNQAPIFERFSIPSTPSELQTLFQANLGIWFDKQYMFRADIIHCQEDTYLVATFNHAVIDAISLWSWHRDLDLLLDAPDSEIHTRNLYPLFAQLHEHNASCAAAKTSVKYHIDKLHGLSRLGGSVFPRKQLKLICPSTPRCARVVRLLDLSFLRDTHGIKPDVFARCALILFNALETQSDHAVFVSWESGRSWPFIPSLLQAHLPNPMDIDGPTVEWIVNLYSVERHETLVAFMLRVHAELQEMQNHVHAPWNAVVDGLTRDAAAVEEASRKQSFVWDVSLGLAGREELFRNMQLVNRYDWADFDLAWNMFMMDPDNLYFVASSQDDMLQEYCDRLAGVMRVLGNRENWDKPISDVFFT